MKAVSSRLLFVGLVVAMLSGCAAYRTESNVASTPAASSRTPAKVVIAENSLPGRKYQVLGPIEISIKKLTIFNKDPTREMADEALIEKARAMGADAVVEVSYKSGIGLTTWGYMDATGKAVKLAD